MKLNAKELRESKPRKSDISRIKRRQIYIICDNILDTYNIGSIFRLADAVGVSAVFLCGNTETPPNSRIAKASVGCDKWVNWQYASSTAESIAKLKAQNSKLKTIAIEQRKGSVDFRETSFREPVTFVVGHETSGVSKEVLKLCDEIVEIPMFGVNKSLNVMVSLAIVLYQSIGKVYPE